MRHRTAFSMGWQSTQIDSRERGFALMRAQVGPDENPDWQLAMNRISDETDVTVKCSHV